MVFLCVKSPIYPCSSACRHTVAHGLFRVRVSSPIYFCKKRKPDNLSDFLWRRRRDSTRLCLVFASQNPIYMSVLLCLSAYRRTWTIRVRVSSPIYFCKKRKPDKLSDFLWRRRRDSNSRTGFPAYALSRGASSPT